MLFRLQSTRGVFSGGDAAWGDVRVWVDANHDGVSYVDVNANGSYDPGTDETELKTFAELDITQINLTSTSQLGLVRDGNEVLALGTFVMDGQTYEAVAANFLTNPNGHEFTASGNGTIVATEGGGTAAGVSSYVSHDADGESIDVDAKGVRNAYGFTGDDTLIGDEHNNWLAGGPGSDVFDAGAGDDVLILGETCLQQIIHAEMRV